MDRLKGKTAIVTGSTSGIGIGIARLYAAEGANVVICGRRQEKGQAVVDTITAEGRKASFHFMDLTDLTSVEKPVEDTVAEFGKIDILVNNAANVGLPDGSVTELTLEMWDNIFNSDLRGTFYTIKCVIPHMKKNGGGSIVNIGSMASCGGDLGATAYACAKAGVNMLTSSVALQYGKDNIRCNCVRPGLIVTPENDACVSQELKDIFLSNIEVNRYGCPEDIGHACVFFGSDESACVTGQIINVDGGMNSHVPTVAQCRALGSRTWQHSENHHKEKNMTDAALAFKTGTIFNQRITSVFWSSFKGEFGRVQAEVLVYLFDHKRAQASEIADALDISKQHVSKIVRSFQDAGYISIIPNPQDRRASFLELNEQGVDFLESHFAVSNRYFKQFFARMTEQEQDTFRQSMKNISDCLLRYTSAPDSQNESGQ